MKNNNNNNHNNNNNNNCNKFYFEGLELEYDNEGYVRSFSVPESAEEIEEVHNFFDKYGFIVFREVVEEEKIDALKDDIWENYMNGFNSQDIDNDNYWVNAPWRTIYGGQYNEQHGFLGSNSATSQAAQNVRCHVGIWQIFATILRRAKIWYSYDRYGLMRPTKNIATHRQKQSGEIVIRDIPQWSTAKGFVHWDLNPWKEQKRCRVQGIVAISDHTNTSGGFHCIPGFQDVIGEWAKMHPERKSEEVLVNFGPKEHLHAVRRITMKKGSVCIWDSRLPHGNWPNEDDKFRMVFYLTFFPAMEEYDEVVAQRQMMVRHLVPDCRFSDLGLMMSGYAPYSIPSLPFEDEEYLNIHSVYNYSQW